MQADVRCSDRYDRLVIVARTGGDVRGLRRALSVELVGVPIGRTAEGAWVAAQHADSLLDVATVQLSWHAEARLFAENRRQAKRVHPSVTNGVARILNGGRTVAAELLKDVRGLEVLDDHQWVNVACMTLADAYGLCLLDEQGAGKTVSLIHAFDVLVGRDEVDFALIVAPKSMVPEWVRDFERFKGDLYAVRLLAGTRAEKRAVLRQSADVLVTNFETAVSMEKELRGTLRQHARRAMLVVDESFFIKNLDAQRTRALKRLRELCGRAFVLCGTPAPNAPHDLVEQFNIVDFGLTFSGVAIPSDQAAAGLVIQTALEQRGVYVRHMKQQVLPDLPGKRFTRLLVPLEPQQLQLYAAALNGLIIDVRAATDTAFQRQLPSFLARRMALLQICSNPSALAPGYEETPAKLRALDGLLEELIHRRHEKVVLWSFFRASLDALVARFSSFHPVRYDGTISDVSQRRAAVQQFQEDDTTMLFIGNPAAGGAGLTLHRARVAIYESLSNQAAHYLQSIDRIHRRGQRHEVEYVVLLCDRTIEIVEYDRLMAKEAAAQQLLHDAVEPPITRELMLHDLLAARNLLDEQP